MFQGLKTSARWMQQLAIPVAVLLLLSFARPVLAAEPQERMREILNAVAAVLKDPSLRGQDKQAERQQRVRQIILDTFDFEEMSKLALGPNWDRLTPQQRTEFVSLFGNLFERSYNNLVLRFLSERQSTYGRESITQDRAVVQTTLVDQTTKWTAPDRVPAHSPGPAVGRVRCHRRWGEPGPELPSAVRSDHPERFVRHVAAEDQEEGGGRVPLEGNA